MQVALFVTCVNNGLRPSTGRAVVTVLERLGHRVTFPQPQTCCGQLHLNAGYRPEGLALARTTIDTLAGCDAVVVPSASCAATMRHLWADAADDEGDPGLADAARALAPKVHELSELLVDVLGVTDVGATFRHRVAYHPTCHSLRSLRVGDRPLRLLAAVEGLDLVELPDATGCCGFGGLFAIGNGPTSTAMGVDKLHAVASTGAEVLCAADNSCLMHLAGLSDAGTGPAIRTLHLAEILASTASEPVPVG
ncbi:MAG TPA: (Fe-S)-binding protein [Acidimicrobiales bacterium]|nr:(Fe-S)-binding protein [Acidimicrobiales bacterium]